MIATDSPRGLEAAEGCSFQAAPRRPAGVAPQPERRADGAHSAYGFNSIPPVKGGKPKVDYLDRAAAGARAREYLGVAKSASDHAGRLIALVVMARYANEDAVARSNRSFSSLSVGRSLPWSGEVLDLVDELAAERLSDHLTAAVREQRADERAQEGEQAQRRASIDERSARLDGLGADEREQLLEDARELLGSWSAEFLELRRRGEALADSAEQGAQAEDGEDAEDVGAEADCERAAGEADSGEAVAG